MTTTTTTICGHRHWPSECAHALSVAYVCIQRVQKKRRRKRDGSSLRSIEETRSEEQRAVYTFPPHFPPWSVMRSSSRDRSVSGQGNNRQKEKITNENCTHTQTRTETRKGGSSYVRAEQGVGWGCMELVCYLATVCSRRRCVCTCIS